MLFPLMSTGSVVEERGVTLPRALVASLLASLRKEGLLNFAVMASAARRAGERPARLYGTPRGSVAALGRANELLQFAGDVELEDSGSSVVVGVVARTCRICPKTVGGLELPRAPLPVARARSQASRV